MEASELRARILETLEKGYLMSLATVDDGGVWVSDVIFVHDADLSVYWMSDPDARHSKAVARDRNVAGTITVSGPGEKALGIQFAGVAEKIEGPRNDLALLHFAKRKKPAPAETDDVLQGDAWYRLTPRSIELIDEELLGFDKEKLTL